MIADYGLKFHLFHELSAYPEVLRVTRLAASAAVSCEQAACSTSPGWLLELADDGCRQLIGSGHALVLPGIADGVTNC